MRKTNKGLEQEGKAQKPMKVLTITSLFPNKIEPNRGIFNLYRIMAMKEYMDVEVIAPIAWFPFFTTNRPRGVPSKEEIGGVTVYHPRFLSIPKFFKIFDGWFFEKCLRKYGEKIAKAEIIDARFAWPDGYGAWKATQKSRAKFCITLHGLTCLFLKTTGYGEFKKRLETRIIEMLDNSDLILAVSERVRDITSRYIKTNIEVSTNGIDTKKFMPIPQERARRALHLPLDKKIILSIGRPFRLKGFFELAYSGKDLNALIYLIGEDRKNIKELKAFIKKNRIENIRMVGEKAHEELYKWYSAADIFTLVSHSEGWPNCVMEALACGTPCVVTKESGGEFIKKELGFITSYANLPETLNKALNREWETEKILSFSRENSWESTARNVHHLFKSLLGKS